MRTIGHVFWPEGDDAVAKDTKKKILEAALEMFSQNGYTGTNMRELMASIGYAKSSTYRHFESKEDIWNTLLDEMTAYYGERFGSPERLPSVPESLDELVEMTLRMVHITVQDETIVKTRKVLTLEQFRDERARDLATKHFLTGLTEMFAGIFTGMMEKELLRRDDPAMLAFAYTTPITALIHLCDREPGKKEEAMAQAEAFSRHFVKIYGKTGAKPVESLENSALPLSDPAVIHAEEAASAAPEGCGAEEHTKAWIPGIERNPVH